MTKVKTKLAILGAGGHGKVCADIALKMNCWEEIVFLDNSKKISTALGLPVIDTVSNWAIYSEEFDIFVALGNNRTREMIQEQLENQGATIATLIHPTAVLGAQVSIAHGTVIAAGAIVNPSTKIGKGVILNTSCTVDHDNEINDFVHISPGTHLAGKVSIARRSWIGVGGTVNNNVSICSDVTVGAGGVVVKDINESGTYIGVPVGRISS